MELDLPISKLAASTIVRLSRLASVASSGGFGRGLGEPTMNKKTIGILATSVAVCALCIVTDASAIAKGGGGGGHGGGGHGGGGGWHGGGGGHGGFAVHGGGAHIGHGWSGHAL